MRTDLNYTSDLADSTSDRFKQIEAEVCAPVSSTLSDENTCVSNLPQVDGHLTTLILNHLDLHGLDL